MAHAAHDDRTSARSARSAARSRNRGAIKERRARGSGRTLVALAVVVSARVSRRGSRQSSNEAEREFGVGRCLAVRPATAHAAHDDTFGARSTRSAARSRNDVHATRRALAVVVSARMSRRGSRQHSNEAEREYDVGRRSAVRPERRTLRTTSRSARARRSRRRDQGTTCSRLGPYTGLRCHISNRQLRPPLSNDGVWKQ